MLANKLSKVTSVAMTDGIEVEKWPPRITLPAQIAIAKDFNDKPLYSALIEGKISQVPFHLLIDTGSALSLCSSK